MVAIGRRFQGGPFDPLRDKGPAPGNRLHLNNVYCDASGLYLSGLNTAALVRLDGRTLRRVAGMPRGIHNARPFGDGVLFNDTAADRVRAVWPGKEHRFAVPTVADLTHTDLGDSRIARAGFARGLCVIDDTLVAAGSSPSTITLHNLQRASTRSVVTLSHDIRNAIHGLEVWPFDSALGFNLGRSTLQAAPGFGLTARPVSVPIHVTSSIRGGVNGGR